MSDQETLSELSQQKAMAAAQVPGQVLGMFREAAMVKGKRLITERVKREAAMYPPGTDTLPKATAAKYGKVQVYKGVLMLFPRALQAVAMVSEYGAKKHEKPMGENSFLRVPDARSVYLESEMRHLIGGVLEGPYNSEDEGMLHKAQKAWNALADLEVSLEPKAVDWNKDLNK